MPLANLTAIPWQYHNDDGSVMAGGTINFYVPGTTTAKAIYEDNAQATSAANPQTLDSAGRWDSGGLFFDGLYDVLVKDADGNTKFTVSNWGTSWSAVGTDLSSNPLSNHSFETAGTGGEPFANWTATDTGSVITRADGDDDQSHGEAGAKFTGSSNSGDYITSDAFEVEELENLLLQFDVKASNAAAQPKIQVNWLNKAQASISTSTIYLDDFSLTPTAWTRKIGLQLTPAATTAYAKLIVIGNASGTSYNTWFDNIVISQRPSGLLIPSPITPQGLELSLDSGDTAHDINVTAGSVKSDDFTHDMVLPSEITKRADAAWAAGDDAGGMQTGGSMPTSGILYVFLIKDSSTGHVDVCFCESATSPTGFPTGYDVKRYLGACRTDSSSPGNFVASKWRGSRYTSVAFPGWDVDSTALTEDSYIEYTLTAPPESWALVQCMFENDAGSPGAGNVRFDFQHTEGLLTSASGSDPGAGDIANSRFWIDIAGSDLHRMGSQLQILLDTASKTDMMVHSQDGGTPHFYVTPTGWDDLKRNTP